MISIIRICCTRISSLLSNPNHNKKLFSKNRIRHVMNIKTDHIVEKKEKRGNLPHIIVERIGSNRKSQQIRHPKHDKQDIERNRSDRIPLVSSPSFLRLCYAQIDISPRISKQFNRIKRRNKHNDKREETTLDNVDVIKSHAEIQIRRVTSPTRSNRY